MKKIAKKMTLMMLLIIFILGCIILFIKSIEMDRFKTFCSSFAIVYTPLIASIGINSAVSKVKKKDDKSITN